MAIELDFDPLSSESREKELPVPVRESDPSRGVVHVTIRDIPRGRYFALSSAHQSAVRVFSAVLDTSTEDAEKLLQGTSDLDGLLAVATAEVVHSAQMARAWQLLHLARKEMVRWGICDHRASDFRFPKAGEEITDTPFEAVTEQWEGMSYRLASPRMIGMYSHPRVGLLGYLAGAVKDFNEDKWKTPEQRWEAYQKAGEAKKSPPKPEPK